MKGRSIHHTVLLCNEVLHFARSNCIPTVFLKIDFRKAFDSLRWDFIGEIFSTLGFPANFQRVLQAITEGSSSQMLVNGQRGYTFLNKAVRQGDPISPLIFLFAMQTLSYCISSEQREGRLHGIRMPHLQLEYT